MRPHRHRLTTNLVKGYKLDDQMRVFRPPPRTREEIMYFHADGERAGQGSWRGWRGAAGLAGPASKQQGIHSCRYHCYRQ